MGELVPFGKYKDRPIERQELTAEPVKILQPSNIVELFFDACFSAFVLSTRR